ncbi:hypothetical protein EHM76_04500 [bacterium]|nr:MAG: hypothetical protein EHM76_04500 [bacterium]
MSGGRRKYDDLLQQYSQGEPTGFMEVGEPEVIRSPAPPPETDEASLWERFANGAAETGGDALRGLNQGLYFGGSDEAAALGRVAQGEEFGPAVEDERGQLRAAQERSPRAFEADRMAGSVPGAMVGGVRAMVPQAMTEAALSGDNIGSGDWRSVAEDAAGGGLLAAGMGAGAKLLGNAAGGAAGWVGDKASAVGDWLTDSSYQTRNRALGGTPGQFQTLAREQGLDMVEGGLGESVERQGLTNRWMPQNAADYSRKADARMVDEVASKNAALTAAGSELGPGMLPRDELEQGIRGLRRNVGGAQGVGLNRDPMIGNYDRLADQVPQQLPPDMSPSQLDQAKMAYYEQGYPRGSIAPTSDALAATAHQDAGRVAKEQLHGAMEYALPETRNQFFDANQNIGELATIGNMAKGAAGKQAAGSSALVNALTAAPGMMGGAAMGDIPGAMIGGYATNKAYGLARDYGPDLAANLQARGGEAARAFGGSTQGMGDMMERFAQSPAPQAASNYIAGGGDSSPQQSLEQGRGFLLGQAVQDALRSDPASLGPYANQFADAMSDPRPNAVNGLLTKLNRTDPTWRTQYLPALRAQTGDGY